MERIPLERSDQDIQLAPAPPSTAVESDPGEPTDGTDAFSWGDAARWSPAEVAASLIDERHLPPEELDELFGSQPDEEVGTAQDLGWYGLVKHEDRSGGLILTQDGQGFRRVQEAETDEALDQVWQAIQHDHERFYTEQAAYELATAGAEEYDNPHPCIWVVSLADYNAGRLYGVWMDATCEPDDLAAATRFMLRGSQATIAEEWGIFDHDGFHGYEVGEYASFATISRVAQGIAEHGEAYAKWVQYVGTDDEALLSGERFQDHYLGHFDSTEAYVENLLEETGDYEYLARLPERLQPYISFDTEQMARDFESELYVMEGENGGAYVFDPRT